MERYEDKISALQRWQEAEWGKHPVDVPVVLMHVHSACACAVDGVRVHVCVRARVRAYGCASAHLSVAATLTVIRCSEDKAAVDSANSCTAVQCRTETESDRK